MGVLRAVLAEIVHLFVDDGSLALALVAWCAAVGAAMLLVPAFFIASGPALFLGCAAILLGNLGRAARCRAGAAPR
jgi:hypothetical protein